jgi:molybdopterin synthase catalytic subunit
METTGGDGTGRVRLLALRDTPLSVDEVLAAVSDPSVGGTAVFIGSVRDDDGGRGVTALGYSAHPIATDALTAVAAKVAAEHPDVILAAVHRVGDLEVGDLAVVVAAAAAHRAEAFAAARQLIDELKAEVPIWKHQRFADGTQEWVGAPT